MREVVLDANVIVAWLDDADVLAPRARELMRRLKDEGAEQQAGVPKGDSTRLRASAMIAFGLSAAMAP